LIVVGVYERSKVICMRSKIVNAFFLFLSASHANKLRGIAPDYVAYFAFWILLLRYLYLQNRKTQEA